MEGLQEGTTFGRYEIRRALGSGAFGAVYEALQLPLRKRVALKILHATQLHNMEALRRFTTEAEAGAKLRHPNIVDVIDLGAHEGVPFIAMEFLEGEALADRIHREGRLSLSAAVDLMLPLCSAVATVHAASIIHRDLKPENVFLSVPRPGKVVPKVLDFGIAKVRESSNALTRTGSMVGTAYYMSPEQARESKDVDERSDQWALAVILYEMVSGRLPFPGEAMIDVLTGIISAPVPPLPVEVEGASQLAPILARALEKDRTRRFPSVRAFAGALLPFASAGAREDWASEFPSAEEPAFDDQTTVSKKSPVSGEFIAPAPSAPPSPAQSLSVTPQTLQNGPRLSESRSSRAWMAGAAAVLVLAAVGVRAVVSSKANTAAGPVQVATPYVIQVETVPREARVEVDGEDVGSGRVSHSYLRDGRGHRMRVSAAGFATAAIEFNADHRPPGQITLTPVPAATAPAPTPVDVAAAEAPRVGRAPIRRVAPAPRPVGGRQVARIAPVATTATAPAAEVPRPTTMTTTGIEIH